MLPACGAHLSYRVPSDAVAHLPLERRLSLLDAESDVLAAEDARDGGEDAALAAGDAIEDAQHALDKARDGLDQAGKTGGNTAIAKALVREAQAGLYYARSARNLARAQLATLDDALVLAQARFELARAREVDSAGDGARYSVRVADYQRQVDRISAFVHERTQDEEAARQRATQLKKAWDEASGRLDQLTGGGQGSIWVR